MDDVRPLGAVELVARRAEEVDVGVVAAEARGRALRDVGHDAEHADDGGRVDRDVTGLVVEADVAAGHRDAEELAALGDAADRLAELPHDARVLRRAEVEAVGDGERRGARGRDVAVGLGERELRTGVGVELGEAAVAVGGHGDAATGLLVDPHDPGVVGLRERRVAEDVAVVLVGDPRLVAEVGRAEQRQQLRLDVVARLGALERGGAVGVEVIEVCRPAERAVVGRARRGRPSAAARRR